VARTGQDAERRAQRGAAQHRHADPAEVRLAEPEALDLLDHDVAGQVALEVAEDLGDAEQPDRERDELQPLEQLRDAEGEARRAGGDVLADGAQQQPQHDHGQRLERRAAGQRDRGDEPEHDEREVLGGPKFSASSEIGVASSATKTVATVPCEEGAERCGGQGLAGAARLAISCPSIAVTAADDSPGG
jgi:hypothetical protein